MEDRGGAGNGCRRKGIELRAGAGLKKEGCGTEGAGEGVGNQDTRPLLPGSRHWQSSWKRRQVHSVSAVELV